LGSICHDDGVLGAALAVLVLGRLGKVVILVGVVPRGWTVVALACTIVRALLGAIVGVAPVLVVPISLLSVLHVGTLVDNCHHLGVCLGVAFEHLAPKLDVVQASCCSHKAVRWAVG
jgi:hypothetical protein